MAAAVPPHAGRSRRFSAGAALRTRIVERVQIAWPDMFHNPDNQPTCEGSAGSGKTVLLDAFRERLIGEGIADSESVVLGNCYRDTRPPQCVRAVFGRFTSSRRGSKAAGFGTYSWTFFAKSVQISQRRFQESGP